MSLKIFLSMALVSMVAGTALMTVGIVIGAFLFFLGVIESHLFIHYLKDEKRETRME